MSEGLRDAYEIIPNVYETGTLFGIRKRNWIEAFSFGGIAVGLIQLIPFTDLVNGIVSVSVFSAIFAINLRGILNRSITEIISAELRFKKNKRILHLRGPEYVKKKQDFSMYGGDESNGQVIIKKFKRRVGEFGQNLIEESDR